MADFISERKTEATTKPPGGSDGGKEPASEQHHDPLDSARQALVTPGDRHRDVAKSAAAGSAKPTDWRVELSVAAAGMQALENSKGAAGPIEFNGRSFEPAQLKKFIDGHFNAAFVAAQQSKPGATADFLKKAFNANELDAQLTRMHDLLKQFLPAESLKQLGIDSDHPGIEQVQNAVLHTALLSTDPADYKNDDPQKADKVAVAKLLNDYLSTMEIRNLVAQQAAGAKLNEKAPAVVAAMYSSYLADFQNGASLTKDGPVTADSVLRAAMAADREAAASPAMQSRAQSAEQAEATILSKYMPDAANPLMALVKADQNPKDQDAYKQAFEQAKNSEYFSKDFIDKRIKEIDPAYAAAMQAAEHENDPVKRKAIVDAAVNKARTETDELEFMRHVPALVETKLAYAMLRQPNPDYAAVEKHLLNVVDDALWKDKLLNEKGENAAQVLQRVTFAQHLELSDWTAAANNPAVQQAEETIQTAFKQVSKIDQSKPNPDQVMNARQALQTALGEADKIKTALEPHARQIDDRYYSLRDKLVKGDITDDEKAQFVAIQDAYRMLHQKSIVALSLAGLDIAHSDPHAALKLVYDAESSDAKFFTQNPDAAEMLDRARSAALDRRIATDNDFWAVVDSTWDGLNYAGRWAENHAKLAAALTAAGLTIAVGAGLMIAGAPTTATGVGAVVGIPAEAAGIAMVEAGTAMAETAVAGTTLGAISLAGGAVAGTIGGTAIGAELELKSGQADSFWAGAKDVAPDAAASAALTAMAGFYAAPAAGLSLSARMATTGGRFFSPLTRLAMRSKLVAGAADRISTLSGNVSSFTRELTGPLSAARSDYFVQMAKSGAWYAPAARGLRFATISAPAATIYGMSGDNPVQTTAELYGAALMFPAAEGVPIVAGALRAAPSLFRAATVAGKVGTGMAEGARGSEVLPAGSTLLADSGNLAGSLAVAPAPESLAARGLAARAGAWAKNGAIRIGTVGAIDYTKNLGVSALGQHPQGLSADAVQRTIGDAFLFGGIRSYSFFPGPLLSLRRAAIPYVFTAAAPYDGRLGGGWMQTLVKHASGDGQ